MKRTASFLQSALYVLIIFVIVKDSAKLTYDILVVQYPGLSELPAYLIELSITTAIILFIALLFATVEAVLVERSTTKFTSTISSLNRKLSVIVGKIDFSSTSERYWHGEVDGLLYAIQESFYGDRNIRGRSFSASVMMPVDGALIVKHYEPKASLLEPNYGDNKYSEGIGYCGTAWERNYPQSGGKRRFLKRDSRYSDERDPHNRAKSYFSTTLFRIRKDKNSRCVLNISSDCRTDFLWYRSHADTLHLGLQLVISLLELCIDRKRAASED